MTTNNFKLIALTLIMIVLTACDKTVTNIVPGTNTSTPQSEVSTPNGSLQADSGGVINGGGGTGVRCLKDGKQTVEVLDLYEAKSIYNLSMMDFGTSEEEAKDKLAQILARHFWNPYTIEMEKYANYLKQTYLQEFLNNIRFIDAGKKLRPTKDAYDPVLETGCEPVQVAVYYDESVLLVDKALWDQMDWTNKMGLLAHEALYFLARQSGTTNSMSTRKLVGMLFSTKGAKPIEEGVPAELNKSLGCEITSGGFSKGRFFMYKSQLSSGEKGLELVFRDLGNDGSLFKTSSFIQDLSFAQLQFPKFTGTRQSTLAKDTYPNRDQISLSFKGILDGKLKADLLILRGSATADADILDVSCNLPPNFDELEPQTTEPAEYESKSGGSSVDRLIIKSNGSLSLEQIRQVGGTGGISNSGVVPYPTVCRYKQFGLISKRDDKTISYIVISGELGNLEGLEDSGHCKDYIDAFNRKASDGSLAYTIRMEEFSKVK